ncbi:MAG: DUF342 domain-containing protein [Leptospiraceae bacterium]|nr:DUF342 domain-containing protein [Leptospiraceae bacterium]
MSTEPGPNKAPDVNDLRMSLSVGDDGMQAVFKVVYNPRRRLHYQDVFQHLNENQIIFGIKHDDIKRLEKDWLEQGHQEGQVLEIIAARGLPMQPCEDGRVEFFIKKRPPVVIDDKGRADFRNIDRFTTVNDGERLARIYPPREGKSGMDIRGHEVVPREPKRPLLETGKNVIRLEEGEGRILCKARTHGIYIHSRNFIDVNPELAIQSSIGLETGNVKYDGNVRVGHNIERGSSLFCRGDLKVRGMVESDDVHVGGSMQVDKGIHASGQGLIKAAGDLRTNYIDNSHIFVEGSIEVQRSINASEIVCMGDLVVADKNGSISGGSVYCFGSIAASIIGNRSETATRIVVGHHVKNIELLKRELHNKEILGRNYEDSVIDVKKVNAFITRMRGKVPADKRLQFRQVFAHYKECKLKLEACLFHIERYKAGQYNKDEVRLIVRDVLHPGVVIQYRSHIEKITAPQSSCIYIFRPDLDGPLIKAWKNES